MHFVKDCVRWLQNLNWAPWHRLYSIHNAKEYFCLFSLFCPAQFTIFKFQICNYQYIETLEKMFTPSCHLPARAVILSSLYLLIWTSLFMCYHVIQDTNVYEWCTTNYRNRNYCLEDDRSNYIFCMTMVF